MLQVIETHPDSLISLRLTSPWPELEKYVASFNMSPEDSMERAHVPFIVVLVRTLQNWRSEVRVKHAPKRMRARQAHEIRRLCSMMARYPTRRKTGKHSQIKFGHASTRMNKMQRTWRRASLRSIRTSGDRSVS